MREILFRGKRTDKRKLEDDWAYGDLLHGGVTYDIGIRCEVTRLISEVDPETVGQYTGVTDYKGRKIFEGDIVRTITRSWAIIKDTAVVEFENGSFILKRNGVITSLSNEMFHKLFLIDVIGNIHDNPELIK